MADYFLYHNLEEGRENKVCLYFNNKKWTYGDVARMSNRTGNVLHDSGVVVEDRVLIVLPDCPEFVWTWFGAARIGAVITMVNPLLPSVDYEYYLEYTRASVAVVHRSQLNVFAAAVARSRWLRAVIVVGDEGEQTDVAANCDSNNGRDGKRMPIGSADYGGKDAPKNGLPRPESGRPNRNS